MNSENLLAASLVERLVNGTFGSCSPVDMKMKFCATPMRCAAFCMSRND
jgi:hypothetical protein